jgi:CcmD family protein
MTKVMRLFGTLTTLAWLACLEWLTIPLAAQPATGAATDGFVPLDSLPPQEQLPAAPLLVTAYAFVWVLLMVYLWSIAKRMRKVESEMEALQRRSPGAHSR